MLDFLQLSLTPIIIAMLAASTCTLTGNFLLLRRQALIGDAISHVVLPGIVAAFLLTGTVSTWPMILGAAGAALLAALMIELIRRLGRVEANAAMGISFTSLFAAGVLLLEISDTSAVHLDVEHALMGSLESLIWLDATSWSSLFDKQALAALPPELPRLLIVLLVLVSFVFLFWRPLVGATFDAGFYKANGMNTVLLSVALVICAALAAVAAFDAVGSILVIAMFICPPAAARLVARSMKQQLFWSLIFTNILAILGYVLAGYGPLWFGMSATISAAGMIASLSGVLLWSIILWQQRK